MARKIEIEVIGNTKDLEKALGSAQSSTSKFQKGLNTASKAAGGALVGLGIAAKKASDDASGLGESVNAVSVVFGKSADKVLAFSKIAAGEAGLSMRAFNELVTPVGASLQNVGFSADQAATASIDLAKRAADMASVFNVDVSEALSAIQSGLRGEADPLERFGVGLSDAAVKAEALSSGLAKSEKEITANDKAQARLALIMEQSSKVAGDFKNTSDSLANSQRINAAEAENTSAKIGKGLLPVMQTFQSVLAKVTEIMSDNIGATKIVAGVLAGLAVAVLAVNAGMKVYAAAQAAATAATWLFNTALAANPIALVVIGLIALGAALVVAYKKSETFRDIVNGAFSAVKRIASEFVDFFTKDIPAAFTTVLNWVKSNWPAIAMIVSGPFAPLVALATDAFGVRSAIEGAFTSIASWVSTKVGEVAGFITGLPGRIADFGSALFTTFTGYFGKAGLGGWVSGRIAEWAGFITGIPGRIADFGQALFGRFTGFFGGAGIGGWVAGRVEEWAGFIAALPGKIADFGADLLSKVMGVINGAGIGSAIVSRVGGWADFFAELPGKAAAGIREKASELLSAVTGIFSSLPGFVKKILGISSPSKVFMDIGHDVVAGIVKGLLGKADSLRKAAIDLAKELAGDAWDALKNAGSAAADAVGEGVSSVAGAIAGGQKDKYGNVSGDVVGLAASFLDQLKRMAGGVGIPIYIQDGFRTAAEQAAMVAQKGLYDPITNPTGAAAVGTSSHEKGYAADITPGREKFGTFAGSYGLNFPVPGEPWHITPFGYDKGGWLMPGATLAINKTGRPEPVLAPGQLAGGITIINQYHGPILGGDMDRVAEEMADANFRALKRKFGARIINQSAPALS